MTSRLAWFATSTGRKFSLGFMSATAITAFGLQYCPHTYLLYKYKEIVAMYQSGKMVPVPERIMKVWNEAITDLSLPDYQTKYLEPFMVFGFDLFHAGTVRSKYGAIVGIPINFTYESVSTLDPTPILVNNEPVNWNRQDARDLLETLVLSEDAKRYAIAREMLMLRKNTPLINSGITAFVVSTNYLLSQKVNENFKLFDRPLFVRGFCYFLCCFFSFGIWAAQIDILNVQREKDADEYLAQLDERYTKGAIEFYTKTMSRNIALRSLLGTEGPSTFTRSGNENFLFRQPRMSLQERKSFFENKLVEIKQKKEVLTNNNT
ncbi:transmembrane protein 177 [Venturia canescens]|uniref:transmembrane protein 177 n=1 Tax=Venturia canescens TaxID=32260 RepID=UPI001C9BD3E6|nr:transmembrane protein 177 [Venturia canescens]XP_043279516.1 transmembrane protein 177 [Venturia canescens]